MRQHSTLFVLSRRIDLMFILGTNEYICFSRQVGDIGSKKFRVDRKKEPPGPPSGPGSGGPPSRGRTEGGPGGGSLGSGGRTEEKREDLRDGGSASAPGQRTVEHDGGVAERIRTKGERRDNPFLEE